MARQQDQRREPPMDLAAEQGVLGACLAQGKDIVTLVSPLVQPEDFYDRRHGLIFTALHQLWDRGHPVDEITVTSYLADQGTLDAVGGAAFLAELADTVLSPAHAEHYASLVADKSTLRRLIAAAHEVVEQAHQHRGDPQEALERAQDQIMAVARGSRGQGAIPASVLVPELVAEMEAAARGEVTTAKALPFGFSSLDAVTGGMLPTEMWTVAGATSMGKTSYMLAVGANAAVRLHQPVLYFGREQGVRQVAGWYLCRECQINTKAWRTGRLSAPDLLALRNRKDMLAAAPIKFQAVRELGEQAIRTMAGEIRYQQSRPEGLGLVVVDYLQLFARSDRTEDITAISRGVKGLAQDLETRVLVGAQLNREVDRRDNHRPELSDLRGSGSIEQDSDGVLLLFRPAYYSPEDPDKSVHVVPGKFRGGERGANSLVRLNFKPWCVRFEDPSEQGQGRMF